MELEAQLLKLWKQAFGEHDGFWELFLETGFSRDRCLYLSQGQRITAALCWFDLDVLDQQWAYVYAVVTDPDFRGRGLCRRLFARAEALWHRQGYAGVLLVPADEGLREMYRKMGYETCTTVSSLTVGAAEVPVSLAPLSPADYAALRRTLLPQGAAIQEGETLSFLAAQAALYSGSGFLLACWQEDGTLHAMELLGDTSAAPGIVTALGCKQGIFRIPGPGIPWAMGKKLQNDAPFPTYFGFAFD